ncbi:MAG: hypothetical protein R3332_13740, partial [Pseudohongiellaceae bacterium]|nr:hypothetical protein [Pseudohongiellaceae bacterium]
RGLVLRRNTATADNSTERNSVGGFELSWGSWTTQGNETLELYTDLEDASQSQNIADATALYYSVNPTDKNILESTSGTATYSSRGDYIATTGGSSVGELEGEFDIDFDTRDINGTLNICIGGSCSSYDEKWYGSFSGTLDRDFQLDTSFSGTIISSGSPAISSPTENSQIQAIGGVGFSGDLFGQFVGDNGEGFVFHFDGSETGNSSNFIAGISLFEQDEKIPVLSQSDLESLTNYGFALINTGPQKGVHIGHALPIDGEAVIKVDAETDYVLKTDNAILEASSRDDDIGGYNISWGQWEGVSTNPVLLFTDLTNNTVYEELEAQTIFVSLVPASVANLVGSHSFSGQGEFIAEANSGLVTSVDGSFDVNLDTRAISNGTLQIEFSISTDNYIWDFSDFTKSFASTDGAIVPEFEVIGDEHHTNNESTAANAVSGTLHGAFTGSTGDGFLLGFDLSSSTDNIMGASVFKRDVTISETKLGFLLAGNTEENATLGDSLIIFGSVAENATTDAITDGALDQIQSNDFSDPRALDESPDLIATHQNAFVDTPEIQVAGFELSWGKWAGANNEEIRVQTNPNDPSEYESLATTALYAIFEPTSLDHLNSLSNTATYVGRSDSVYSSVLSDDYISDSHIQMSELRSIFDIDFSTGNLTNGAIVACLGGSNCGDATETWKVSYTGDIVDGVLTNFTIVNSDINDGVNTRGSITGYITGAFIGDEAEGFVGGFAFTESGAPQAYASATYLLKDDDFLTAAELLTLEDGYYGFLSTAGDYTNIVGGRAVKAGGSGNVGIGDYELLGVDGLPTGFEDYPPLKFIREGLADLSNYDGDVGGLGELSWGQWLGSTGNEIYREEKGESTVGTLAQDAFWFVAKPSIESGKTGHYRMANLVDTLVKGGSNSFSTFTQVNYFGFDVDFDNGSIENGHLSVTATNDTWLVDFSGDRLADSYSELASMNIHDVVIVDSSNNEIADVTVEGGLTGMFIDQGQHFASSFAFNNSNVDGNGEYVAGNILVGLGVGWGAWNNPIGANWDSGTIAQTAISSYFGDLSTLVPTITTGEYSYSGPTDLLIYAETNGYEDTLVSNTFDASFDIDFGTGAISNGVLDFETSGTEFSDEHHFWNINYSGQYADGQISEITIDQATSAVTHYFGSSEVTPYDSSIHADSQLGGIFVGDTAETFVGAFELIDADNTAHFVQGLYTLDQQAATVPAVVD